MKRVLLASAALLTAAFDAGSQSSETSNIDPAAIALYHQTNAQFLARIRTGLRANVQMEQPDGTVVLGYDEYAMDDRYRLREVRRDRESVVVGEQLCVREGDSEPECDYLGEIEPGLRPVVAEDVFYAALSNAQCGSSTCRQVDIRQRAETVTPEHLLDVSGLDAGEPSHYRFRLLVREDGLPYSVEEMRLAGERMIESRATFTFDYSAKIAPISLGSD